MSQPVDPPVARPPAEARVPTPPPPRVPSGDGERFAAVLAGAERRAAALEAERRGGGGEARTARRAIEPDAEEGRREERGGVHERATDGSVPPAPASVPFGAAATEGGPFLQGVGTGGGAGTLEGPLTAADVAGLVERLDALASSAARTTSFRVVDGLHGIASLHLVHSEAGWRVQLDLERTARAGARRQLAELEEGLAARGLRVDAVGWREGRERDDGS